MKINLSPLTPSFFLSRGDMVKYIAEQTPAIYWKHLQELSSTINQVGNDTGIYHPDYNRQTQGRESPRRPPLQD